MRKRIENGREKRNFGAEKREFSPRENRNDDSRERGERKSFGGGDKFERRSSSESFGDRKPRESRDGGFGGRSFDRDNKGGGRSEGRPFEKREGGFGGRSFDKDNKGFGRSERGEGRPFEKRGERSGNNSFKSDRPKRSFSDRENNQSEENGADGKSEIRLNRFISNAGICSRREADELISSGQISVNGATVTEMGYKVAPTDVVKYGKKVLNAEKLVYLLLNKPKDYITTMDDPDDRKTVMDVIDGACTERIYPVGRLDRNTTGLLLLTNDGELADKLTHPSGNVKKVYQAELDRPMTTEDFEKLQAGVELEDGFVKPDALSIITPDAYVIGIEIHSGRNRIVRRMFEHLGYDVKKLDRTTFAGLTKKELPRGSWRMLTQKEVIRLKYLL